MKESLAKACISCSLAAGICVGCIMAVPTGRFDAKVSMDTVDVRIEDQPMERTNILDDEHLELAHRIENAGQDCYIRVRVEVEAPSKGIREPGEMDLQTTDWIRKPDGWAYYRPVLHDGETIQVAEIVRNPQGRQWDGTGFTVDSTVTVQAVQASSFSPDYSLPQPWGDTPIAETEHSRAERTDTP